MTIFVGIDPKQFGRYYNHRQTKTIWLYLSKRIFLAHPINIMLYNEQAMPDNMNIKLIFFNVPYVAFPQALA